LVERKKGVKKLGSFGKNGVLEDRVSREEDEGVNRNGTPIPITSAPAKTFQDNAHEVTLSEKRKV
jgi:hypothetical protein